MRLLIFLDPWIQDLAFNGTDIDNTTEVTDRSQIRHRAAYSQGRQ